MNKSESVNQLALALSKLQGEVQNVYADQKGYGYNYADLSSILEASRPLLAKFELAVTQLCSTENSNVTVETVLLHSSGEWLSSTLALPVSVGKGMSQAQAIGSCISYGRRYSLAALLGIAQTDNDASVKDVEPEVEKKAEPTLPAPLKPQEQLTNGLQSGLRDRISKDFAVLRLKELIEKHGLEEKSVAWLEHFKVYSLDELGLDDLLKLIKKVEGSV